MAAPITTATPSPRTTTPKPPSSPSPHHHPAATPPRCHAIPIIIIIIPSPSSCHHHRDIIPPPPPGGMSGIVLTPQGVLFRWTTATMGVSGWLSTAGDSRGCLFRWAFTATRGASFTQRTISSISVGGSINLEGFLSSILLSVNHALLSDPLTSGIC
ncbi:hypothetical protein Tco_0707667 [Tanacetum coccineum]|uniref:Uncharacterized protein n=1 Tax=Tanacetum coccineum TaxID=301880 RepID=A0ABQ4YBX1_9ASTR